MQWTDVTRRPEPRLLRQFAALWIVVFGGLAGWRAYRTGGDVWTDVLLIAAVTVGTLGLVRPTAIRWVYTGWMVAAFPIGWTVSQIILGATFLLVLTPIAVVMRLTGHDPLRLRRRATDSYWAAKPAPAKSEDYLRQF
jgi:hypothetical protein